MTWDLDENTTNTETQTGEVKYLQLIADLCKEERKLLGLYAPEKKETNDRPNAIQFNILGSNAGEQATDIMNVIMNLAPSPAMTQTDAEQQNIKETEDVEPVSDDMDNIMAEMLGQ